MFIFLFLHPQSITFFIVLIFLFFSAISIFTITAYNHIITDKMHTITEAYTATISSNLTLLEKSTRETAALLKNSKYVQTALSAGVYDTNSVFEYDQTIRNEVVNIMHVNNFINMIYIGNGQYDYSYYILSSDRRLNNDSFDPLQSIYSPEDLLSGVWINGKTIGLPDHTSSLYFVQKIQNLNTVNFIGYIVIEVDSSFLDEAIDSTVMKDDTTIAFIMNNDLLYKSSQKFSEKSLIKLSQRYNDITVNNGFKQLKINGQKYFLTANYNESLSLHILSLISYRNLMGNAIHFKILIMFFITIFLLILFLIVYHFSERIVWQVSLIKNIFNDSLTFQRTPNIQPFRNDEIGQIGKECEALLGKYNISVRQAYELNIKQKESELLRLQEQINPHFLYNTLDSIFWMCETNGNHDAAQMSLYLSRYFRSNISQNELTISIREEISSIQNYLAIQNIRYKNKFNFVLNVNESLYDIKILRMLIQPLIENAIFHGLEPKRGTGTIELSIYRNNEILTIITKDNGVGFTSDNFKKGIALKNIDERIKLFYGGSYGAEITSQPSVGTTVTLKIALED